MLPPEPVSMYKPSASLVGLISTLLKSCCCRAEAAEPAETIDTQSAQRARRRNSEFRIRNPESRDRVGIIVVSSLLARTTSIRVHPRPSVGHTSAGSVAGSLHTKSRQTYAVGVPF